MLGATKERFHKNVSEIGKRQINNVELPSDIDLSDRKGDTAANEGKSPTSNPRDFLQVLIESQSGIAVASQRYRLVDHSAIRFVTEILPAPRETPPQLSDNLHLHHRRSWQELDITGTERC